MEKNGCNVPVFLPVLGRGYWTKGCDRRTRLRRWDETFGFEWKLVGLWDRDQAISRTGNSEGGGERAG